MQLMEGMRQNDDSEANFSLCSIIIARKRHYYVYVVIAHVMNQLSQLAQAQKHVTSKVLIHIIGIPIVLYNFSLLLSVSN